MSADLDRLDDSQLAALRADLEAARGEAERLKEALRYIAGWDVAGYESHMFPEEVARKALEGTE